MQTTLEQVNSPSHYNKGSLECIDGIQAALTPNEFVGFLKGQQLKYVWRAGHKESSDILTDIRKSQWYANRLLSFVEDQHYDDAMTTVVAFHNEAIKEEEKPEFILRYFPVYPIWWENWLPSLKDKWLGPGWYCIETYTYFAFITDSIPVMDYEAALEIKAMHEASIELDK